MKILLVDDDHDIANYMVIGLARFGLEIHHVLSGEEVMNYLTSHHVDLILLDWNMPGMSGLEVLEVIRTNYSPSDLPVIMVTSINESKRIVQALEKGSNDYITKPLTLETVAARIKTQLSLKSLHEQNAAKGKLELINEVVTTLNHEINNPLFIALNHIRKARGREDYSHLEKVETALVRITNIVKQISALNTESKEILKKDNEKEAA